MAEGLRERRKALTRRAIIGAAASLATDVDIQQVPMTAIAEAAEVSERTLYNYFPTKDDLIGDLAKWIEEAMRQAGFPERLDRLDQLPEATRAGYEGFSAVEDLTRVYARIPATTEPSRRARDANTLLIRELVDKDLAGVPAERRQALAALLRALSGSAFWYRLTQDLGVPVDVAADTVAWAVEVIIDRARDAEGETPTGP